MNVQLTIGNKHLSAFGGSNRLNIKPWSPLAPPKASKHGTFNVEHRIMMSLRSSNYHKKYLTILNNYFN
jgi:hypothetical protein